MAGVKGRSGRKPEWTGEQIEEAVQDPELGLIVTAWPKLPEHVKAAVLALVRSASDKEQTQ